MNDTAKRGFALQVRIGKTWVDFDEHEYPTEADAHQFGGHLRGYDAYRVVPYEGDGEE